MIVKSVMEDPEAVEDLCDQCQGEATLYCRNCSNSYCSTCSSVRHRSESRREHDIVRVSKVPNVSHTATFQTFQKGKGDTYNSVHDTPVLR